MENNNGFNLADIQNNKIYKFGGTYVVFEYIRSLIYEITSN